MLKRSGAYLLTLLYIVTVVGFALNLHYCGKLITGVKIDAVAKGCNQPMAGKMKCCKDKQIDIKIKDAHQNEVPSILGKLFSIHVVKSPFTGASHLLQAVLTERSFDRIPPERTPDKMPVFITNCTFRI